MSAPSLTTHTGTLTARQRANDAWSMPELPEEEELWHQRLMRALRNVERTREVVSDTPRDPYRWRKEYRAHLMNQLRDTCHRSISYAEARA